MTVLIAALESEVRFFTEHFNCYEFTVNGKKVLSFDYKNKEVLIFLCGIGKVNAALTAQYVIDEYAPDYIINFGTAGGLNKAVDLLNYYLVDESVQYDFDITPIDDVPLGYMQEYGRSFFPHYVKGLDFLPKVKLATADRFTSDDKDVVTVLTKGCAICDMEGAAIAQVCYANKTKLITVKGITDVLGGDCGDYYTNSKAVAEGFPSVIGKILEIIKEY